jgi:hypothetical protein
VTVVDIALIRTQKALEQGNTWLKKLLQHTVRKFRMISQANQMSKKNSNAATVECFSYQSKQIEN